MDEQIRSGLLHDIARKRYGKSIDFGSIEETLAPLRKGGALEYRHLEAIADDRLWPFSDYWEWPPPEKIGRALPGTEGIFVGLPVKEPAVINMLLGIFKDISLVSIILRFVHPKHYGIYSYPPLYMLRVERGPSALKDFQNYLKVLRALKNSFNAERVADVDMMVWSIAESNNVELADELKNAVAKSLPQNLSAEDLLRLVSSNPLELAKAYLNKKDHKTAGYWASRAFEKYLADTSMRELGYIPYSSEAGSAFTIIEHLGRRREFRKLEDKLHYIRKKRNTAIHDSEKFTPADAVELIKEIEELVKA